MELTHQAILFNWILSPVFDLDYNVIVVEIHDLRASSTVFDSFLDSLSSGVNPAASNSESVWRLLQCSYLDYGHIFSAAQRFEL